MQASLIYTQAPIERVLLYFIIGLYFINGCRPPQAYNIDNLLFEDICTCTCSTLHLR